MGTKMDNLVKKFADGSPAWHLARIADDSDEAARSQIKAADGYLLAMRRYEGERDQYASVLEKLSGKPVGGAVCPFVAGTPEWQLWENWRSKELLIAAAASDAARAKEAAAVAARRRDEFVAAIGKIVPEAGSQAA